MKKSTVVLLIIALTGLFAGLVYYGVTHSVGVPVKIEKIAAPQVEVPFLDKTIDLKEGISPDTWNQLNPQEIKLMYQVTVLPWPKIKGGLPFVTLKAFHNKEDIYFYLSWPDDSEDRVLEENKFPDACAIMFTKKENAQPHTIMMGFLGRVNIWQWKANQDREYWKNESVETKAYADYYYPFEEQELFPVSKSVTKSAVNDLLAIRVGTITPKDTQEVMGRGIWQNGVWIVVFKRALIGKETEEAAQFKPGKMLSALAVWNGAKGDRGGRKSISDWVELIIK